MTLVLTPVGSETTQPPINQQSTPSFEQVDTEQFTPRMKDFNITKAKRQQLRGLLINSQPLTPDETARQRRSEGFSPRVYERESLHEILDEVVRWNTFLVHTGLNLPEVLDFVFDVHKCNEEEYQRALAKAVESQESFMRTTCNNIEEQVTSLVENDGELHELDDVALTKKIEDSFSPDKFFAAFAFMKDYLNFEDSSSLGKWYAKGIYINTTRTVM